MDLKDKKLFLLDMDGTVYIDDVLIEGAAQFIEFVKSKGGRCIFLTNNSSRSVAAYVEKLSRLGIKAREEDFLTSVDCTIDFLNKKYGPKAGSRPIVTIGTRSFREQLRRAGFNVIDAAKYQVREASQEILLLGFDRELTYAKLVTACKLLADKDGPVDYVATNPDWVCPTEFGSVPDCGSISFILEKATGRKPRFIGKPEPDMALSAMKKAGFTPRETLLVGDRIYTDIACGKNAGVDTCFLLSGEGTLEDIKKYGIEPTIVLSNIAELLRRMEK